MPAGGKAVTVDDAETETTWVFDQEFLTSNWECVWGRGCQGILDHRAEELQQGCCSLGAEVDPDEARNLTALAAVIDPSRFQYHQAAAEGVLSDSSSDELGWHTRVIDDACIFLNRPGFEGGAGCALHLEAMASDESPLEWKPSVCWQLPVHVDWERRPDGGEVATVRRWNRDDWGQHGETMAWVCTEESASYIGETPVVESLEEELKLIVGTPVYLELKRALTKGEAGEGTSGLPG